MLKTSQTTSVIIYTLTNWFDKKNIEKGHNQVIQITDIVKMKSGRHMERHLEYLITLNDARMASSRILKDNVYSNRIYQEKNFIRYYQVHRKSTIIPPD